MSQTPRTTRKPESHSVFQDEYMARALNRPLLPSVWNYLDQILTILTKYLGFSSSFGALDKPL
jgi:hypothetical protein